MSWRTTIVFTPPITSLTQLRQHARLLASGEGDNNRRRHSGNNSKSERSHLPIYQSQSHCANLSWSGLGRCLADCAATEESLSRFVSHGRNVSDCLSLV